MNKSEQLQYLKENLGQQGKLIGLLVYPLLESIISGEGLKQEFEDLLRAAKSYTDTAIADLVDSSPDTLDTLKEIAEALNNDANFAAHMVDALAGKVDKVPGKGLSTNDFTHSYKNAVDNIATTIANALSEYLTKDAADKAYQPKGNYLTKAAADEVYQPKGEYLTKTAADQAYQPKGEYLTKAAADQVYQPKGEYLTKADAGGAYQPKGNYLVLGGDGVTEMGRYIDLHVWPKGSEDYSVRLDGGTATGRVFTFPATSGALISRAEADNNYAPKSSVVTVENVLTSTSTANALSAAQGKVLNDKIGSMEVMIQYTVNLSSLSTSNFYPVTFGANRNTLECQIMSPSFQSSAPYNCNYIHFLLTAYGWSDTPKDFVILSQGNYDNNEIVIGAIGYGLENGEKCVWLRGGYSYSVKSTMAPTLRTSNYSNGNETYTVGTNLDGGTNARVTICWKNDSTRADSAVAKRSYLQSAYQPKGDYPTTAQMNTAINTAVSNAVVSVYKPKGSKSTIAEVLAISNASVGDVYDVTSAFTLNGKPYPAGTNVVCITATTSATGNESKWDPLGGTVDLSNYLTATEVANKYLTIDQAAGKYATITTVNNKVDKVSGKGLSTNDFTASYKTALDQLIQLRDKYYGKVFVIKATYSGGTLSCSEGVLYDPLTEIEEFKSPIVFKNDPNILNLVRQISIQIVVGSGIAYVTVGSIEMVGAIVTLSGSLSGKTVVLQIENVTAWSQVYGYINF